MIESCEIQVRVRYPEVDRSGAVHHSRYWVYFEMGRTELPRLQGVDYRDLEDKGILFVMAKCSAKYLAAARYDDLLTLSTRITRTGRARIDHAYELKRQSDGMLLTTAETTLACVDTTGRIIPIPPGVLGEI